MKRMALAALAALVVASAAMPAGAATRPDDRPGARGPGAVLVVGETTSAVSSHPDDRAGPRGPGAGVLVLTSSPPADGFDWRAAGLGLAGGLVLALAAVGVAMMLGERQRAQRLA